VKKNPLLWALAVGTLALLWQVFSYYFRFGQFNPHAAWTDYLWFFLSGVLGGLLLAFFLSRQHADKGRWTVLTAFALATPVAMIFMLGGGLLGALGTLFFPQVPWLVFTWVGSLLGKFLGRR